MPGHRDVCAQASLCGYEGGWLHSTPPAVAATPSTYCAATPPPFPIPSPTQVPDIFTLTYVPWGNAQILPDGKFECQHGEMECIMNTVHACVLYYYPDRCVCVCVCACVRVCVCVCVCVWVWVWVCMGDTT